MAILKVYNGKYPLKHRLGKQPYPGLSHTLIKILMGGGRLDWEFGITGCKLLHVEWIKNKVLYIALYSMSFINYNRNEYEIECYKFLYV